MYQKYQSEAIVLRSYERGEADRVYALYTREFGLVWARATAVRRENSRMRYAMQSGAQASVSLVRGARGWRLVGAAARTALDTQNVSGIAAFVRIAALLERLVHGEEANEYLFQTLAATHIALMHEPKETHAPIELLAVARILYSLGYLSQEALGTALFTETAFTFRSLQEIVVSQRELLSSVNKALAETQL